MLYKTKTEGKEKLENKLNSIINKQGFFKIVNKTNTPPQPNTQHKHYVVQTRGKQAVTITQTPNKRWGEEDNKQNKRSTTTKHVATNTGMVNTDK